MKESSVPNEIRKKKSRRQQMIPFIPSLITTGNLFFGLLSIATSIQIAVMIGSGSVSREFINEKFWWAGVFILIAGVLDFLDGRAARAFKFESNFGLSYDSLCDVVSFGVAPGVLAYVWALMGAGKLGLMAALFYTVCTALRLARFNVQSKGAEKFGFTGLPSPMAAGLIYSPILLFSSFQVPIDERMTWLYFFVAPFAGLMMVSDVPYRKYPRLGNSGRFNALVVAAIIIAAIVTNPEVMIISVAYLYCFSGLILYIINHLKKKSAIVEEAQSKKTD